MHKKITLVIAVIIILIIGAVVFAGYKKNNGNISQADIVLFYGEGCSHCVNVDKFIQDNDIENKIRFDKKEVFYNRENANLLAEKAQICGMPTDNIGVPFLWEESTKTCKSGDADIINYFKAKINI